MPVWDGTRRKWVLSGSGVSGGGSGPAPVPATTSTDGLMSAADKAKLDLIDTGAEVNVQADWAQTDNTKDDFIKGKPATFTPPVATAAVLGGVKAGTGVAIAKDGTLSLSLTGGLIYKGTTDPTAAPPASPATGDVWIASKDGAYNAGWKLTGTATEGELLIWQGAKWDPVGQVSTPVKPDWNAAAGAADEILNKPTIPAAPADASETVKGVIQLATTGETFAGTSLTKAVTPSGLRQVMQDRMPLDISSLPDLP